MEHLKLIITLLHGKHGPHACEQSGMLDPVGYKSIPSSTFFPSYKIACHMNILHNGIYKQLSLKYVELIKPWDAYDFGIHHNHLSLCK